MGVDLKSIHIAINLVSSDADANMMSRNIVHRATQEDVTMMRLLDHIQRGMPDSGLEMDKDLREFHRFQHDLRVVDGVLCYRDQNKRGSCMTCIREVPSQPAAFQVAPPSPDYLFQMLVAKYFSLHGHNFLVIADRFTRWNAIVSTTPAPGQVQQPAPGHYHERLLCHLEHFRANHY